jgi:DNA-binding winged helix-turn-helix (wHTH) protein
MPSDVIRLGDALELDRRAYELRRSGRSLRLERIPMELLLLLVERRGELVTREEIIEKIWGKDVFLDTDSSINAAIRKIRQALKDDPERPLFVQTITGKGYRFVAAVEKPDLPSIKKKVEFEEAARPEGTPQPYRDRTPLLFAGRDGSSCRSRFWSRSSRCRVFSAVSRSLKYRSRSEARDAGGIAFRKPQ